MGKSLTWISIAFILSFCILIGSFLLVFALADINPTTNVILLGWDGVQRNHLFELLNRDELPNLRGLIDEGTIVNVTVSDHSTDTTGGWSQVLTGYRWWRTGVYSNEYWFHSIPDGYTIPERVENHFGKANVATAFITGCLEHIEVQDWTGSTVYGRYTHEAIYSHIPSTVDVCSVADRYANVVGPLMLQFLENYANRPFFAFFHFVDPDVAGHQNGENSALYEESIKICDYWLGQIASKLSALNILQKTWIYLTSDHGFDENGYSHLYAPEVFLATNDNNVKRDGDQVDVASTVCYGMGIWGALEPQTDGYPLQTDLPNEEEQNRQTTLADETPPATPLIASPTEGANITGKIDIEFSVSDAQLSAVLLLIDNHLENGVALTWSNNDNRTAYGSCKLDTHAINTGYHLITILAFDEHGALNKPTSTSVIVNVSREANIDNENDDIVLGLIATSTAIVIVLFVVSVMIYRKRSKRFNSS